MKQLPLQLSPDPVRSLESFVSTGNELLLAHIGQSPVPKAPRMLTVSSAPPCTVRWLEWAQSPSSSAAVRVSTESSAN